MRALAIQREYWASHYYPLPLIPFPCGLWQYNVSTEQVITTLFPSSPFYAGFGKKINVSNEQDITTLLPWPFSVILCGWQGSKYQLTNKLTFFVWAFAIRLRWVLSKTLLDSYPWPFSVWALAVGYVREALGVEMRLMSVTDQALALSVAMRSRWVTS